MHPKPKKNFEVLLERARQGEEITIIQDGKYVAKLVPADPYDREDVAKAFQEIEEIRKQCRLDGLSIKDRINEGRR
ncbi:MAG: type II toxin-antitoxin system Phd/YefM family antitoxin [bacterium]